MADSRLRALLVLQEPDDAAALQAMIDDADADDIDFTSARDLQHALSLLSADDFDIILLDLGLSADSGVSSLRSLRERYPDMPILVLGRLDDEQTAIRAVKEGAQDYLVKHRINGRALLRATRYAVERHMAMEREAGSTRQRDRGRCIAFIGAKGGVGATTVALNVAAVLAAQGHATVLAEMRGRYGTLASLLSLRPVENLSHLVSLGPEGIDGAAVERRVLSTRFGVRALLGPQAADEEFEMDAASGAAVVAALGAMGGISVLDMPAYPGDGEVEALRQAWRVLLVTDTDAACVRAAEVALERLRAGGVIGQLTGAVVVNRVTGLSTIPTGENLQRELGLNVVGAVPPAAEACVAAQSAGIPVVLMQPNSVYAASLGELADRVSAPHMTPMGVL